MDHSISVNLVANIDRYKQGMQQAKQVGTESLGFIASIFDKIKSMFAGLWDSFKSIFTGLWDKVKSGISAMSESTSGAFQKLTGSLSGTNGALDETKSRMAQTEDRSVSLAGKIGVGLVAAVVAVTGTIGVLTRAGLNVAATFAGLATSSDIAVSQLSRFDDVAARNGMSLQQMGDSMAKFKKAMSDAAASGGQTVFDKLGVKVTDSNNALLQTDQTLVSTAKKIAGMSSEAEKFDAASKIGFGGKVQLLEDIAHASNLTASQTDDQAAAVVRLGKIWHEILPGGKSMWADVRDAVTTRLTPAMTEASTSILEAKNRITDAFQQIFSGGSWLTKLGDLLKDWSQKASHWFDGVAKSATNSTIEMMKWIAAKTGLGNPDAFKPGGAGYIPGPISLTSNTNDPVTTQAEKDLRTQLDATNKSVAERIEIMKRQIQLGAILTDGQRAQLQIENSQLKLTPEESKQYMAQAQLLDQLDKQFALIQASKTQDDALTKKQIENYANWSALVQGKIDEDKLQIATSEDMSESQKLLIKLDAELASGKLKLAADSEKALRAKLADLGVTEEQLKAEQAQREVAKYINESVIARNKMVATLETEYAMYGKSSDARAIAMVAVDAEIWRQQELAAMIAQKRPITQQALDDLAKEKALRIEVGQATLSQTQALHYASQLADENKKFGLQFIADDQQRAAAELAIDAQMWQDRINLAGDGTKAQMLLQEQYDIWYRNQAIKPQLEAQKKLWDSVEQTAHETFVSIFDSGKSAFDRLRDALKNGLMDLLYQLTVKRWLINIQASVGMSGAATAASAAGSAVTGGSSLLGAAGNALSIYRGIGAGALDLGGSAIAGIGNFVGSSSLSAFGAGFAGNSAGMAMTAAEGFANAGMAAEASAASLGASVAAALPYVGAAVAAFALLKKGFSHGPTEIASQGVRGTLTAGSLTGESYQNLHQDGGWFTSDRNWTDTKAITAALSKQMTEGLSSIETAAAGFAKSLGVSADWVTTYSKSFDLALTGDATKDQQAVTDFFAGVSDEIAAKLVPSLTEFQKSGETLSAALQRLAGDFQSTDQMAQLIGKTAAEAFGTAGIESAKVREQLISLAGGASTLTSQAQTYAQNFLTAAERLAPVQKAVDAAMQSLGLSSVQTRDQFKAVVNSLDLTTEAGAKQFTEMMALADAFSQVHPAADDAATAIQKAADAFNTMKEAGSTLLDGVDSAYAVLQKVVEREKSSVQASIDAHQAAADLLQGLSESAKSAFASMRTTDQKLADRAHAQAEIRADLAITKAGGTLSSAQVDSLKKALSGVTVDASSQFSTYQDYLKDLYRTQNDIAALGNVTDDQLSVEKAALDAAQQQLKALDGMLAKYQDQIDALKGQSTTLLSIDQAAQGVLTAILAAKANPIVAATSTINDAYQSSLGRTPDAAGLAYWQKQAAAGVSPSEIQSAIASSPEATLQGMYWTMFHRTADADGLQYWLKQLQNGTSWSDIGNAFLSSAEAQTHSIPGFATGGDFGGGWRIVGENGPELEATGPARIFNAGQTSNLFSRLASPSGNNDALVAEVKALRQELAQFHTDNTAENRALAKHAYTTADVLERNTAGGGPMLVEIVS